MSEDTIPIEILHSIEEVLKDVPSHDRFDHGFGLDFFLSIPRFADSLPSIVQYLQNTAGELSGSQRGHVLGLALMPFNDQHIAHLRTIGRDEVIKKMREVLRDAVPPYRIYLNDPNRLVRYWAIWAIWFSQIPDSVSILRSYLPRETDPENQETIRQFTEPSWRPSSTDNRTDGLPF